MREGVSEMQVGSAIKKYLKAHGIKQAFIAGKCGWTPQKLNNVLSGRNRLFLDDYQALCKCIVVPYELFLDN